MKYYTDLTWNLFSRTGDVDLYLMHKEFAKKNTTTNVTKVSSENEVLTQQ